MSKSDKLIERIKARPPEAAFEDVRRVLELHGWVEGRKSGSHVAFRKGKGEGTIVIPVMKGRKVKRVYLDIIIERLGL
ncbi:MAG: type II toxin-antitoxin system HicA family toxin [Dehalococcoidia bacterium]